MTERFRLMSVIQPVCPLTGTHTLALLQPRVKFLPFLIPDSTTVTSMDQKAGQKEWKRNWEAGGCSQQTLNNGLQIDDQDRTTGKDRFRLQTFMQTVAHTHKHTHSHTHAFT